MFLFTVDTKVFVYIDSRNAAPTQAIRGRDGLRPVFENLSTYQATTHFNGQSTVTWAQGSATWVSYALRITWKLMAPSRSLMIASSTWIVFMKIDDH
jgi:hypothetical protein